MSDAYIFLYAHYIFLYASLVKLGRTFLYVSSRCKMA